MAVMRSRAHVVISGFVQGVSFRWYATQHARSRSVGGWVRNTDDGRVEAVFEGNQDAVQAMVDWCHVGPRSARVTDVTVDWQEPEGLFEFDVEL
jgi:acylphosphatase